MSDPTINLAVAGMGWWGRRVTTTLLALPGVQVLTGVDPSEPGRAACAELGLAWEPELANVLHDPRVEAIVLCTPHPLHVQQIVAAAGAGKHVFCEKPLATRAVDARAALAAVDEAGVQLGVGHERRFEPPVQALHSLLRDGELGTGLLVEGNFSQDKFLGLDPGNWRLSPEHSPVGPLSATGIHMVDLAVSLLGRPTEVWARLTSRGSDFPNGDTLAVTLGFESGATAALTAILATPFVGRLMLLGSLGWYEIRDRSHPEAPSGWDVSIARRGQGTTNRFHPAHDAVGANLAAFLAAVRHGRGYPIPREDMIATVEAYEGVVRSVATGAIERVGSPAG